MLRKRVHLCATTNRLLFVNTKGRLKYLLLLGIFPSVKPVLQGFPLLIGVEDSDSS